MSITREQDDLAVHSAAKAEKVVIAGAKRLKVIGRARIGMDNIDISANAARGIVLTHGQFGNSITTLFED